MTGAIKPAMTPEEWEQALDLVAYSDPPYTYGDVDIETAIDETFLSRHALAALALYGQPFGFHESHVLLLRELASEVRAAQTVDGMFIPNEVHAAIDQIADRIAALLPPGGP